VGSQNSSEIVDYTYDAFISYRRLPVFLKFAKKLELDVKRYNKSLIAFPRRIFRDDQELQSGEYLEKIFEALKKSKTLIFLASPETRDSEWISKELEFFCTSLGRADDLIILKSSGQIVVENEEINWSKTDALPEVLQKHSVHKRRFEDATQFLDTKLADLKNPEYRELINQVVAKIENVTPNELSGLEWRLRRRTLRNIWTATTLFVLALFALIFSQLELRETTADLNITNRELETKNTELTDSINKNRTINKTLDEERKQKEQALSEKQESIKKAEEALINAIENANKAKFLELQRYREASVNEGTKCRGICSKLKLSSFRGISQNGLKLISEDINGDIPFESINTLSAFPISAIIHDAAYNYDYDRYILAIGENRFLVEGSDAELIPGRIIESDSYMVQFAIAPGSKKVSWRANPSQSWSGEKFFLDNSSNMIVEEKNGILRLSGVQNKKRSILEISTLSNNSKIYDAPEIEDRYPYEEDYDGWEPSIYIALPQISLNPDEGSYTHQDLWPVEFLQQVETDEFETQSEIVSLQTLEEIDCSDDCPVDLDWSEGCGGASAIHYEAQTTVCWSSNTGSSGHTSFALEVSLNGQLSNIRAHFSGEYSGDTVQLSNGEFLKSGDEYYRLKLGYSISDDLHLLGIGWNTKVGAFDIVDRSIPNSELESCEIHFNLTNIYCLFNNGELRRYEPKKKKEYTTYRNFPETTNLDFENIGTEGFVLEFVSNDFVIVRHEDVLRKYSIVDGKVVWAATVPFFVEEQKIDLSSGMMSIQESIDDTDKEGCLSWWVNSNFIVASCAENIVIYDNHTGITIGTFFLKERVSDIRIHENELYFLLEDDTVYKFSLLNLNFTETSEIAAAYSKKITPTDDFPIPSIIEFLNNNFEEEVSLDVE